LESKRIQDTIDDVNELNISHDFICDASMEDTMLDATIAAFSSERSPPRRLGKSGLPLWLQGVPFEVYL
jgi:hypothetical protein